MGQIMPYMLICGTGFIDINENGQFSIYKSRFGIKRNDLMLLVEIPGGLFFLVPRANMSNFIKQNTLYIQHAQLRTTMNGLIRIDQDHWDHIMRKCTHPDNTFWLVVEENSQWLRIVPDSDIDEFQFADKKLSEIMG